MPWFEHPELRQSLGKIKTKQQYKKRSVAKKRKYELNLREQWQLDVAVS
jgi:hypothetical protein